jgi:hypothetical protein
LFTRTPDIRNPEQDHQNFACRDQVPTMQLVTED